MARGIYRATGYASDPDALIRVLTAFSESIDDELDAVATLPFHARDAGEAALQAIRTFEALVVERCGAHVGRVSTPAGPAIELGNRTHVAFGAQHEEAAAVVAAALAALLTVLGATSVRAITMD